MSTTTITTTVAASTRTTVTFDGGDGHTVTLDVPAWEWIGRYGRRPVTGQMPWEGDCLELVDIEHAEHDHGVTHRLARVYTSGKVVRVIR